MLPSTPTPWRCAGSPWWTAPARQLAAADHRHRGHSHHRRRRRGPGAHPRRRRGAGPVRPHGHARHGGSSQPPLLHGRGRSHAPDELHGTAALPRLGGHHHTHHRKPRHLRRTQPQGRDRARAATGPPHPHHGPLHDRGREPQHHDAVQGPRTGAALRALLGRGGRDLAEGLHDDQRRGSGRRHRRSPQAGAEGDRTPVLDQLHRGGGARDRQHRAWTGHQQRLRARQGAGPVPGRPVGRGGGCGRGGRRGRGDLRRDDRERCGDDIDAGRVRALRAGTTDARRAHARRHGALGARGLPGREG